LTAAVLVASALTVGPVMAQQATPNQNLQNEADKGIKTQNTGASGNVGSQASPGASAHPPGQPGAPGASTATSAQNSGAGISGAPGCPVTRAARPRNVDRCVRFGSPAPVALKPTEKTRQCLAVLLLMSGYRHSQSII
jgi:hypothetical protein